jgi:hypothetical protein
MVKAEMVNGCGLAFLAAAKNVIFRAFAYKNAILKIR